MALLFLVLLLGEGFVANRSTANTAPIQPPVGKESVMSQAFASQTFFERLDAVRFRRWHVNIARLAMRSLLLTALGIACLAAIDYWCEPVRSMRKQRCAGCSPALRSNWHSRSGLYSGDRDVPNWRWISNDRSPLWDRASAPQWNSALVRRGRRPPPVRGPRSCRVGTAGGPRDELLAPGVSHSDRPHVGGRGRRRLGVRIAGIVVRARPAMENRPRTCAAR